MDFLDLELDVLDTKIKFSDTSGASRTEKLPTSQSDFTWTDNKTHLIEILESILHLRSINNGKVVKSEFMMHVGNALNIDLKNHSGLLNDILNRYDDPNVKNSRIYYVNTMCDALSDKLEQLDHSQRNR